MSEMYICLDCGEAFDREDSGTSREWIGEDRYESNSSGWMYYTVCPRCGSDEIAEAEQCDECGEYYDKTDMIRVGDTKLCHGCANEYFEAYWDKWGYTEKNDIDRAKRVIQLNTIPHASGYKNLQRVMDKSVFKQGDKIGLTPDKITAAIKEMGFKQVFDPTMKINVWEKGERNG